MRARDDKRPDSVRRSPCLMCGRRIAKRPGRHKARYPHLCPHGRPCPAGDIRNEYHNGPMPRFLGGCPECSQAEIDRRR